MKPLAPPPNLTERVYGAIADEILDGKLPPGHHLVQERLADELKVSRQPIQQAMALLKADGLVEESGRRGLTVARLDPDRMRHHYEIRAVLDSYAARTAAQRVATGDLSPDVVGYQTADLLREGRTAVHEGTVREQIQHDEDLHNLIYDFTGNPVLAKTARPNWRFLRRAMAEVLRHGTGPHAVWEQHGQIVDAIIVGDADTAERLARGHVETVCDSISASFSDTDLRKAV